LKHSLEECHDMKELFCLVVWPATFSQDCENVGVTFPATVSIVEFL